MSLYNMVFGHHPLAGFCLHMLDATTDDFGRFRNGWIEKHGDEYLIAIYTRCGGGNRDEYAGTIAGLQSRPDYVRDFDDNFDCTYATFLFRPDLTKANDLAKEAGLASWEELASKFVEKAPGGPPDWLEAIARIGKPAASP